MNDIQSVVADLREKGWTQKAIADELGTAWQTVHRWGSGQTYPPTSKPILAALESLADKKPPPKRRYPDGHYMQRRARGE